MNAREEYTLTGEASISPLAERILRNIEDTEFTHCSAGVETLRITVGHSTFRAMEGILRQQQEGFTSFMRQKEREYIQGCILEGYLHSFFPEKPIHIQLASWSDDISHGIDAFCQIGKMQYAVDFTSNKTRIQEKIAFCRSRNDRKGLTNRNMWIVYIPLHEIIRFHTIIDAHISQIDEPSIMHDIFNSILCEGHHPECEVYSVKTGQTPSIFLDK